MSRVAVFPLWVSSMRRSVVGHALRDGLAAAALLLCCELLVAPAWANPLGWSMQAEAQRRQVEAAEVQDRVLAAGLARQALSANLSVQEQAWFLDHLATDLFRLRRWVPSLEAARQGQRLSPATPEQQVRFATLAGYALIAQGQPLLALQEYDAHAAATLPALMASPESSSRLTAVDARRMRAGALQAVPRNADAMALLTAVLADYEQLADAMGQAESLHMIAALRFAGGDMTQALQAQQQAIDIAEREQLPGVLPKFHALMGYLEALAGQRSAYQREMQAAAASAALEGDEFVQAKVTYNQSDDALERRDWPAAIALTQQAEVIFTRIGDLGMVALCQVNRGVALNRLGRPQGMVLLQNAVATLSALPGQEPTAVDALQTLAQALAVNHQYEQAYAAQVQFQRRSEALHQADNQKHIAQAEAAFQDEKKQRQIENLEREQAVQLRMRWLGVLVGALGLAVAVLLAINRQALKKAYRISRDIALQDPLTGLHNRRFLVTRFAEALAKRRRQFHPASRSGRNAAATASLGMAFLLVDIDHFKQINDRHGHAAGDAVLQQCAALLKQAVRGSDSVVRWGGEEFLVLAELGSQDDVLELAERICAQMAAQVFELGEGAQLRLTCSLGFVAYPCTSLGALPNSWEGGVSLADQCLYVAKQSGRNLWVGVQPVARTVPLPDLLKLQAGLAQGWLLLSHRPGRAVQWPAEGHDLVDERASVNPPHGGPQAGLPWGGHVAG